MVGVVTFRVRGKVLMGKVNIRSKSPPKRMFRGAVEQISEPVFVGFDEIQILKYFIIKNNYPVHYALQRRLQRGWSNKRSISQSDQMERDN